MTHNMAAAHRSATLLLLATSALAAVVTDTTVTNFGAITAADLPLSAEADVVNPGRVSLFTSPSGAANLPAGTYQVCASCWRACICMLTPWHDSMGGYACIESAGGTG